MSRESVLAYLGEDWGRVKDLIRSHLHTDVPLLEQTNDQILSNSGKMLRPLVSLLIANTISKPTDHVLNIQSNDDPRTQQRGWSFVERSYNFDSAAGINYTVDVTKPVGERITITTTVDGQPFELERTYNVGMTSYRASGGGNLLQEAGIDTDNIDARVVARYPEIRNILYDYLMENGSIDPEVIGDPKVIGRWSFVPEKLAAPALAQDMALLFRR